MTSYVHDSFIKEHFSSLCRFCMQSTKAKTSQFEKLVRNKQICKQFIEYFGIELIKDDELPSLICSKCNALLPKYLAFHQKCLNSYHHLKSVKTIEVKEEKIEVEEPCMVDQLIEPQKKEDNFESQFDCSSLSPKHEEDIASTEEEEKTIKVSIRPRIKKIPAQRKPRVKPTIKRSKDLPYSRKLKQCNVCGKLVKRLENHMIVHATDQAYICHFCNRRINAKVNLLKHLRIHLQIRNFKCHLCPKDFIDSSSLKVHLVMHSGKRDYKCDMCDLAFNQHGSLKFHLKSVHFKQAKYFCENCERKFYIPSQLRKHMNTVHAQRPKCEFCSKILKNQKSLDIHIRVHTGKTEFICNICTRPCSTNVGLQMHKKCHENTKGRKHIAAMRKAKLNNFQ